MKSSIQTYLPAAILAALLTIPADAQDVAPNVRKARGTTTIKNYFGKDTLIFDNDGDGWDDIWCMIYPKIEHRNKTTDTDGDGCSDYDEMTLRRCPMTKGPLPVELTPEQIAAATAKGEEARKAAEAAKLARLMPKLQAGLETARRMGAADRASDWLTTDRQKADLAELAVLAKDREERHRLDAEARITPGPIKDMIDRGDISARRIGPNGVPDLVGSYDLAGADTISTDDLWPGGAANNLPDLSGTGRFIGIWEAGGYPFFPHTEFIVGTGSKVFVNDTTNPTVTVKSHATQVAGVMAAVGLLPSAKGMSFGASLLASTDLGEFSETAAAAAAGMTLSNHSYGDYAGWHYFPQFSNLQWVWTGENVAGAEKRFGFYNTDSRKIDLVTYGAPGYLPVYASGNDVADTGPAAGEMHWLLSGNASSTAHPVDGGGTGFDTLTGRACSLNSLVVGSVYPLSGGYQGGAATVSPFSSRGPTDDGRIKPDLVASGEEVVSSQLETAQAYAVQNSSFEVANLAVGGSTTTTTNWQQSLASGGEARVWRIQYSGGFNFAELGTHALGLTKIGSKVYQDLPGVTLQPNTTYNINFRVGRLNNFTDPSTVFWLRLYANGFGSLVKSFQIAANAIPVDEFLDGTLTYDAPANPPAGALRLVLEHGGPNTVAANGNTNYAFFDWVRIERAHNLSALPTNLYTDDSDYGRERVAGTSFAAPAVTGSINLLQEQLQQGGGGTLWASAWKALAIGTADDVGNPGPDYTFGWGLMNTRKAAEHLARHLASQSRRSFIRQNTLFDGNTIEYKVKAAGGEDLVATLAYAPPAYQNIATANEDQGIPANTLDPTTSMLVNDVDIQFVKPDGTVIGPWLLNPSNPAADATAPAAGNDDDRNNVKQVRIPAAQVVAGQTYTVRVKQDGALKVAVKQPGTTNYTLTGSQPAQPAFQSFAVVTSGNVDRAEDGFMITDFDRVAGLNYIEWRSVKGIRYRIQTSLDLVNWTTLPGDIDGIGETTSYTDQPTNPNEVRRFYRVAEITP